MLHINNLPTLVLYQILKTFIGKNICDELKYKRDSIYLQVCHLWRHIGYPLVYHTIFFNYSNSLACSEPPWISNVSLARTGGCNFYVKSLAYLCFDYEVKLPIRMKAVLEMFNMGLISLPPEVESLLDSSSIRDGKFKTLSTSIRQQTSSCIKSIVDKFAHIFPNIACVEVYTEIRGQPLCMLFYGLVNAYSS